MEHMFLVTLFDEVVLDIPGQKQFKISAKNNSDKNIYIQSVSLNGEEHKYSYITHKEILKVVNLNLQWGQNQIKILVKKKI